MDALEQLRSDIEAELVGSHYWKPRVLAARDEFTTGYEAVEVEECDFEDDGHMHILRFQDSASYGSGFGHPKRTTILVPRERKPSLLGAAGGMSAAWHKSAISTPAMCDAMLVLDTAIEKERSK